MNLGLNEPLVDRGTPVPLYYQIARQLEQAIDDGRLAPGSRLESEPELARRLGVSRPTVRKAIAHLVDRGLVIKRHGVGTMIAPIMVRRPVALTSFYDDLATAGHQPTTKVLAWELRPAPGDVAERMMVEPKTELLYFERLRYARREPIALMQNYVLAELAEQISAERLAETGFYRLLELAGGRLRLAHQTIGARAADDREAGLLDVAAGDPVLTVQRTSFDDAGRCLEFGLHVYRSDSYAVELSLVSK
jgi:DNA-binding GntR family transcriptional regulator